jgi:TonB family protein
MFAELKPSAPQAWRTALLLSFALHAFGLLLLSHHLGPTSVLPHEVALGTPYSSGSVIYLAPLGREQARDTEPLQTAKLEKKITPLAPRSKPVAAHREEASKTAADAPEITGRAGSPYGVHIPGTPLTGPAVMPALPQVFPDPPVSRADIPAGVEGDVIVEVTIDEQGNVSEMKLTQGIGYGIDEKVMAVLRRWHFRPATRNGVNIASQHLVHFHYPA